MIYETFSPKETYDVGVKISQEAKPGDIYCLLGDIGVGKTVFSKGFAKGLHIDEPITSPTFTIVNEYEGRHPLYHFDLYRIEDGEELEEIGFEEYLFSRGVCLIEWAERIEEMIPEYARKIIIEKHLEKGFDYRKITMEGEN